MKKLVYCSLTLLLLSYQAKAQTFLPFATSNYAGITSVQLQPASIADSRYKFDISVFSTDVSFYNTFYGIDPNVLRHPKLLKDLDFNDPASVTRNMDGMDKTGIISQKQDIFSFMITLSDKAAIAFTPSVRSIINIDNMTETMAVLLDGQKKETNLWNIRQKNENLNVQINSWMEYGFTYARVLMDNEKNFLKAGATMKINQGLASAYSFMKDLTYEVNDTGTISLYNSFVNYGTSDNLGQNYSYHFFANPSLSFDFGVVYEFRPDWIKYKYEMDGKPNLWRKDQNKYFLRIGFTVSDLGSIHFQRNPDTKDFTADIRNLVTRDLEIKSLNDFNQFIADSFNVHNVSDQYNVSLPVCLSMQADVRITNGFYVNFTPFIALNRGTTKVNKTHYISTYNLIPRYDIKWFGVSVPVQYNSFKQWNIGLGLRIGPVWFGSNDIFSILASSKNRYGTSASVVLKIPIFYSQPNEIDINKAPG